MDLRVIAPPPERKSHNSSRRQSKAIKHSIARASDAVDNDNNDDNADGRESLRPLKRGRLPREAMEKTLAFSKLVKQQANILANKYGKNIGSIMNAAGLYTKPHQAWYASTNPKISQGKCFLSSGVRYVLILLPRKFKSIMTAKANTMLNTKMKKNMLSFGQKFTSIGVSALVDPRTQVQRRWSAG